MSRNSYSSEFNARAVLEVLREGKTLDEIMAEKGINPNMLRNWKQEFLNNASAVFDQKNAAKEERRKEKLQNAEKEPMLQMIGQLTLERDFLQCCFRKIGQPISNQTSSKQRVAPDIIIVTNAETNHCCKFVWTFSGG